MKEIEFYKVLEEAGNIIIPHIDENMPKAEDIMRIKAGNEKLVPILAYLASRKITAENKDVVKAANDRLLSIKLYG